MIDLHCHIIPGVDDGPQSLEESLSMARMAVEDGVHTLVATPHSLNGVFMNPIDEVILKLDALQDEFLGNHIDLQLYAGADVHICPGMLEKIDCGDAGTIGNGKKYILVEFPSLMLPFGMKDEIFKLRLQGITPIITHPERYRFIHQDIEILIELIDMGALCQVTAMSITGDFGENVKHFSEILLRHRLVHLIASDAHSSHGRPPILSDALEDAAEVMGSYEEAERMVKEVPAAILSGSPVEIPEPGSTKRKGYR